MPSFYYRAFGCLWETRHNPISSKAAVVATAGAATTTTKNAPAAAAASIHNGQKEDVIIALGDGHQLYNVGDMWNSHLQ